MKESVILSNIKSKLGISNLNDMQLSMLKQSSTQGDISLLSPTGSGKTIAFLLPSIKALKPANGNVQAVIIAPSRELVIQIYEVARAIASDYKVTCCYGGHNVIDEKQSLSVTPDILVATPGRLLDHLKREHLTITNTRVVILDEFDKSLELGFHDEMKKILKRMPNLSRKILTSATKIAELPDFISLRNSIELNFLYENESLRQNIVISNVLSPGKDKLPTLLNLIYSLNDEKVIVFANFRDAVDRIHSYLLENKVSAGLYHGALEQIDREKAISMFNNGSHCVLVTTDLGSRGLDISNVDSIVHYHLPVSEEVYTHRNGRTARMLASGNIYVITSEQERIPEYMKFDADYAISADIKPRAIKSKMSTLYFMAGKKEKISRGDIVGFIAKNANLDAKEIGVIDVKDHYSLVAVPRDKASSILSSIEKLKIKNKKIKIGFAKIAQ